MSGETLNVFNFYDNMANSICSLPKVQSPRLTLNLGLRLFDTLLFIKLKISLVRLQCMASLKHVIAQVINKPRLSEHLKVKDAT